MTSTSVSQIPVPVHPLPSQEAVFLECFRRFGEPVQTKEYKTSEKIIELWDKAINKKDPRSMVVLGVLYAVGFKRVLKKDYSQAFHWFTEAEKLGEADALIYLLWMAVTAQHNESKKGEFKRIVEKIKHDAAEKIPAAEAALGVLYLHASDLPSEASVSQSPRLLSSLSSLLTEEDLRGSELKNPEVRISTIEKLWTDAARNGSTFAMPLLASILFSKNEDAEATSWCEKAIEGGNPHGYYTLALHYRSKGTHAEYIEYLKKGADAGDQMSIKILSDEINHSGNHPGDLSFEINQFIQLCKECAELGDGSAMEDLGFAYASKNLGKLAAYWMKQASLNTNWFDKQDRARLAYRVFCLYVNGRGDLLRSPQKAVKWLKKAAELGHGQSIWDVSRLFYTGEGGRWDPREAMKWEMCVRSLPSDEEKGVFKRWHILED